MDTGQEDAMRSHPALIEQIAVLIHREHLPYDQAEARNAAGWELEGGRRHTLTADELAEAYAEAMRRHAADRAARRSARPRPAGGPWRGRASEQRSRNEDGRSCPSSCFAGDAAHRG